MSDMTDAEREAAFRSYMQHNFRLNVAPESGGPAPSNPPENRPNLHGGARPPADDAGDAAADEFIKRYITRGR